MKNQSNKTNPSRANESAGPVKPSKSPSPPPPPSPPPQPKKDK